MKWASRQAYPVFMVTYLGCRSEISAVGLIPGSRGYRTCGISHLSTVASQAGDGSKPENLSQAPTNMSSFSLVFCCSLALGTLQEVGAVVAPLLHLRLCVLHLSLNPPPAFEGGQEVMLLSAVVSGRSCPCARVRACVRPLCCSSSPLHQSCRGVLRP